MKYSVFDSRTKLTPAEAAALEAQKAEFLASGKVVTQLPPQHFAKTEADSPKLTTYVQGKPRNGSRTQQTL